MPPGQPTKYNEDMQVQADAYVESFMDDGQEWVPTRAGLALKLGVTTPTLDNWKVSHPQFFVTLGRLKNLQEDLLLRRGLTNIYNPTITKLMLHNHGYADKTHTEAQVVVVEKSLEELEAEEEALDAELAALG